jgi:hypothetical protein
LHLTGKAIRTFRRKLVWLRPVPPEDSRFLTKLRQDAGSIHKEEVFVAAHVRNRGMAEKLCDALAFLPSLV